MSQSFTSFVRDDLVRLDGVRKLSPTRRALAIFTTESVSDSVFFVESGFVKIVRRERDSREVLVGIVPPGNVFGEEALFVNGHRQFAAEVLRDGTVYEIPRELFLEVCKARPDVWRMISEVLALRARDLQKTVATLCVCDVELRILHCLRHLAPVFGRHGSDEYTLPMTQVEVAQLVGATRETTSTILNCLDRRGLIILGRGHLRVPSISALQPAILRRKAKARAAGND